MTQEVLKLSQEALAGLKDVEKQVRELIAENKALKEALREHAMREVQRLGQKIEQEPIGTVKELFTQTAWERLDLRGSTKVYLNTTPPQRGKEPVKYSDYEPDGVHHNKPPQRAWVGLTDEEIAQGCKESWVTEQAWQSAVWWAEAKLKEKNI